jgi:hypothetical protein
MNKRSIDGSHSGANQSFTSTADSSKRILRTNQAAVAPLGKAKLSRVSRFPRNFVGPNQRTGTRRKPCGALRREVHPTEEHREVPALGRTYHALDTRLRLAGLLWLNYWLFNFPISPADLVLDAHCLGFHCRNRAPVLVGVKVRCVRCRGRIAWVGNGRASERVFPSCTSSGHRLCRKFCAEIEGALIFDRPMENDLGQMTQLIFVICRGPNENDQY